MPLPMQKKETYTLADVFSWEELYELIDGVPYLMAPPSSIHQKILTELLRQFANFLDDKTCEVFPAPFGVRLFEGQDDRTEDMTGMVLPDISVVCDPSKLDRRGCKGAPDLVIEVLSPSNRPHDRLTKHSLYQEAGVREYWIVDPDAKMVQVFLLNDAGYYPSPVRYGKSDTIQPAVLPGCVIDLKKVFRE